MQTVYDQQNNMKQLARTNNCKCCNKWTENPKGFDACVAVAGKDVIVQAMIEIFALPECVQVDRNDCICLSCVDQLEKCYNFYHLLLATQLEVCNTCSKQTSSPEVCFQCTVCDLSFTSKLDQEQHIKIQHSRQPRYLHYHCQPCGKLFKTNRGMLQHNTMYHDAPETHTCHMCERQFLTKTNYQNHMRYHKDHVCSFCNSGWLGEPKLLEHVRTAHPDRQFVCRFCDKKERMKKSLNRHLRSSHGQQANPYHCGYCGSRSVSFESYETLMDHLNDQHNGDEQHEKEPYETLLNDALFAKDLELPEATEPDRGQEQFLHNFHLVRTEKQDPCQPTELRIDQRMVLEDFLDEAFENDEIWNKYIENGEEYLIDDYDIYLREMEGNGELEPCRYRCPQCQRGFQKQHHLSIHLAEEHNVPSLVCNDCGASFTRIALYRTHRLEHLKENVRFRESNIPEMEEALSLVQSSAPLDYSVHESEQGYRYTCNRCERSFQRKHNLEKHCCEFYERPGQQGTEGKASNSSQNAPNTASSEEIIYCMLCDRRFSSTSGLKYHLKRHTGIKAFTCLYCGKKFTANSNLNAHIRNVHSERKDHRCTECDESFATKDHLNKHQRSRHRQDRAFGCTECGKSYFQRSHLNEHMASCHREDRYLCTICNSSFVLKRTLKRHQQKKHGTS
uniref:C2H2-type domain-containing protein n=1 Tax=Anopheles farauti TaxID=69004 RepID=A0A182Q0T0_9DIPT